MQTSNFTPRASYKNRHKVLCLKNKDTFYLKKVMFRGRLINDHTSSRPRNGFLYFKILRGKLFHIPSISSVR